MRGSTTGRQQLLAALLLLRKHRGGGGFCIHYLPYWQSGGNWVAGVVGSWAHTVWTTSCSVWRATFLTRGMHAQMTGTWIKRQSQTQE